MLHTSTSTNAVLVNMLVRYGHKLTKPREGGLDSDQPVEAKVMRGATIELPIPSEDYFLFTICSSGLARVLSTVSNRNLTCVNDVKILWQHYHGFSTFFEELLLFIEKLYEGDDRSEATAFMNLLGRQALQFFDGQPSENVRSDQIRNIDFFLKMLIDLEVEGTYYKSSADNHAREKKLGNTDFIISVCPDGIDEDEEDWYQPISIEYSKKKEYSYSDIQHIVERGRVEEPSPPTPKPEYITLAEYGQSLLPRETTRADRFFADCENDFGLLSERLPAPQYNTVRNLVRQTVDQSPGNLGFYAVLGYISSTIKSFLDLGKAPQISSSTPAPKAELILLLWGDQADPQKRFCGPPGTGIPVPSTVVPVVEEDDASFVERHLSEISLPKGKEKKTEKQISVNLLHIALDMKTAIPNPFCGIELQRPLYHLGIRNANKRRAPQRRTPTEFRYRKVNSDRDRRSAYYSKSGTSFSTFKRTPRQAGGSSIGGPSGYHDAEDGFYSDPDYPDDYYDGRRDD